MSYPGGKGASGVYQKIISMMPPHKVYIETFLGAGTILKTKIPAKMNIGIESNHEVLNLFPKIEFENKNSNKAKLILLNCDAVEWLRWWGENYKMEKDTLVYCDPPYLPETIHPRGQRYDHKFTKEQHIELLNILKSLKCYCMISGYQNKLYDEILEIGNGRWHRESFTATCRRGTTVETVWMNFPTPTVLHDYRFIGQDYRERERLKLKLNRLRKKLQEVPAIEKNFLLEGIRDLYEQSQTNVSMSK